MTSALPSGRPWQPNVYVNILRDLRVSASIGVHPEEIAERQTLLVTIWLECQYAAAVEDRLDAVVDYDFLRAGVLAMVAERHFTLQETLCDAIAQLALSDSRIRAVRVRSMKPDIYPDADIGCEVVRCADQG